MQPIKETAYNIAASAKSGMDKTKAVAQEKMERMTAHNQTEKELATEKREQRIQEAEFNKQNMQQAAHPGGTFSHSTTGTTGQSTGPRQMSALPGHGTGHPAGQVVEGAVQSHPIGTATGTERSTTAHNTNAGTGDSGTGYGTGGYTS